jgi:hypothetical protein
MVGTKRRWGGGPFTAMTWCLAALVVACSGQDAGVSAPSLSPVATLAPADDASTSTPATDTAQSSTSAASPASSVPATNVASTSVEGGAITGPMFSDELGVKVDTAPGVNTRGDTRQLLPEGLYVHIAWESDPDDLSVFTVQPDDIEILEAYANATLAYYTAALSSMTIDAPEFTKYFVDRGAEYEEGFAEARLGGYVASLGSGVILRPYVLGDQRTETSAVVFDCYLEDQDYIARSGGVATLGPLETSGTLATMSKRDGSWKVDVIATETAACL